MATWFYEKAGERAGPVSETELVALERRGEVTATTLVWTSGMTDWQPLASTPLAAARGGAETCSQCGAALPLDDLARFGADWVCAGCKPLYLQRVREGVAAHGVHQVWRSGKDVVTLDGSVLPSRCIKCGEPVSSPPIRRKLYWHSPWYYLILLINVLIFLLVAIVVRRRGRVEISVCDRHRRRRGLGVALAWLCVLSGVVLFFLGIATISGRRGQGADMGAWLVLGSLLVVLIGTAVGLSAGRYIVPRRIEDGTLWLRGAGPAFLDGLPAWNGRP